jgi:hypothetical protein
VNAVAPREDIEDINANPRGDGFAQEYPMPRVLIDCCSIAQIAIEHALPPIVLDRDYEAIAPIRALTAVRFEN